MQQLVFTLHSPWCWQAGGGGRRGGCGCPGVVRHLSATKQFPNNATVSASSACLPSVAWPATWMERTVHGTDARAIVPCAVQKLGSVVAAIGGELSGTRSYSTLWQRSAGRVSSPGSPLVKYSMVAAMVAHGCESCFPLSVYSRGPPLIDTT